MLLIDLDELSTAALAQSLASRGAHVFFTAAPHVARRLSQECYFDLVVIDDRLDGEAHPSLADVIARDGHRCVVLSVGAERRALQTGEITVRGGIRRPLEAERVFTLSVVAGQDGRYEEIRRFLDLSP